MMRTSGVRLHLASLVLGTLATIIAVPSRAAEDMFDGNWHFGITPYLWLPDINGTVNYSVGRGGSISAKVDPGSYLENLDFAAMLNGEARKGNWSVFTDYIFMHMNSHDPAVKSVTDPVGNVQVPINLSGSSNVTSNIWTLAGGYTVWRGEPGHLDVFAGVRLLNFDSTLGWNFSTPVGLLTPGARFRKH